MIWWVAGSLLLVIALFVSAVLLWPKKTTSAVISTTGPTSGVVNEKAYRRLLKEGAAATVYIDAVRGNDETGDGSEAKPLRTIRQANKKFARPAERVVYELAPGVYMPPRPDAKTVVGMMGGPEEGLGPDPQDVKDEVKAQRDKVRKRARSRRARRGY